jgi:hypothetical protein
MTTGVDGTHQLAFGAERAMRELREHVAGRNVLAILTDATADEWHRRWQRSDTGAEQIGIVDCFEFSRGATATQTTVVNDDLAISTLERPIDPTELRPVLERYLDGWESGQNGTVVYIDSLGDLLADADREAVEELLRWLRDRTDIEESGLVATADDDCPPRAVAAFGALLDETAGHPTFDTDAQTAVRRLRTTDPTTFGYFRSYWPDAIAALERADRSFVQAGQLEAGTDISTRMLGATLSAFAQLEALSLRADTNGPNRYDLRSYDPDRAAELGLAVDALPE